MNTKKCTCCGETLSLAAFNHRSRSRDRRASICRRCASRQRQERGGRTPRQVNALRAAIKLGDFTSFQRAIARTAMPLSDLMAIAVQDYSTAPKAKGHLRIIDFLLKKGAPPHWSFLIEAARTGSQEIVDRLLAAGAQRNIFAAALIGDASRVGKLLKKDAALARVTAPEDLRHYASFSPLHFCALSALGRGNPARERQFVATAERLLHAKAPVNAQGCFYGYVVTPLDMLAQTGGNMALARLLLARGAAISTFGFLEALCHRGRSRADGFALAELFLQHGFDIHSPHEDGTILHRCANTGSVAVAEWLIERGSDVSRRGRMGRTPLHLAAERNRTPAMVEFLVNQGAPRDARDEMGLTPLDVARQHGRTRLFKALTP